MQKQTFCYNSRKYGDDISTCIYGEIKALSLELARALASKLCYQNHEVLLNVWEKQK